MCNPQLSETSVFLSSTILREAFPRLRGQWEVAVQRGVVKWCSTQSEGSMFWRSSGCCVHLLQDLYSRENIVASSTPIPVGTVFHNQADKDTVELFIDSGWTLQVHVVATLLNASIFRVQAFRQAQCQYRWQFFPPQDHHQHCILINQRCFYLLIQVFFSPFAELTI